MRASPSHTILNHITQSNSKRTGTDRSFGWILVAPVCKYRYYDLGNLCGSPYHSVLVPDRDREMGRVRGVDAVRHDVGPTTHTA